MAQVTNLTRDRLDFVVGARDGAALTESLAPGETRDLGVDLASAQVRGRVAAQAIRIDGGAVAALESKAVAELTAKASADELATASTLAGPVKIRE